MLAKLADFLSPRLKPAIAASRRRELESAIKRNDRAIVDADGDIAQAIRYKENAITENATLRARLARHNGEHSKAPRSAYPDVKAITAP